LPTEVIFAMSKFCREVALVALCCGLSCEHVAAHFIWIMPEADKPQANVYFGELAAPDDPELLKPLAGLKLFGLLARGKFEEIELRLEEEGLVGESGKARLLGTSFEYGVLQRGDESFLLQYHAAAYRSPLSGEWKGTGDAARLPLEIIPSRQGRQITLTLLWQGEPVPDAEIVVSGAGLSKLAGKTDSQGRFICEPTSAGTLAARAKHVETKSGQRNEQAYNSIRHWTTLTVPLAIPTVQTSAAILPSIERGMTSFGAALAGEAIYVYGGHWGGAHEYSTEEQSNELHCLRLGEKPVWEKIATGPRRSGTALVAWKNKLFRVGGFEVGNKQGDDDNLHSMPDVDSFDLATGKWTPFSPLPRPRSSHDAVVLGNQLYVVGGWNLQAGRSGEFHGTLETCDLAAENPEWKTVPTPFKRRALSAAVHEGKLYVLGGMEESGAPTTAVAVYDPASGVWSEGPSFHGVGLEGFGSTAYVVGGKLTLVTLSGAIQQLSADGRSWQVAGQLEHPRFFARLVPLPDGRGAIVAGADMVTGKVLATEVIAPMP
jgi:hypothetical protein